MSCLIYFGFYYWQLPISLIACANIKVIVDTQCSLKCIRSRYFTCGPPLITFIPCGAVNRICPDTSARYTGISLADFDLSLTKL